MGSIQSNATLHDVAMRLKEAQYIVLTAHAKPDGDAFGGTLAIARALERLGKHAEIWHIPPVPRSFDQILGDTRIYEAGADGMPSDEADLVVVVDTSARSQLESLLPYVESRRDRVCVIDHHIQGDDIAGTCFVDSTAGSASEIIVELIPLLGLGYHEEIATPLYLGIATDTGWFRFSNTSAKNMRYAATLLEAGADHNALLRLSEQCDRPSRLRMLGRALQSLEYLNHGRVALLTLRHSDYEEIAAGPDDTHGFADLPLCVEPVEMVCVIAESEKGVVKLSLRSKPGNHAIDVNAFAAQFGGGGHARASGAKIEGESLDNVRARVVAAIDAM